MTYKRRSDEPVYFIDLDGVHGGRPRQRVTTVLGFNTEEVVARDCLAISVSAHPVDSVNLKDARLGLYERVHELIVRHGVTKGRVNIALSPRERQAGLTVNEYETLLMRHDLAEVLSEPFRFVAEKSRHLIADPRAIPKKTIGYAKYDLVRVFNELVDAFGLSESVVERMVARFIGAPASRFLRNETLGELTGDRSGHGRLRQHCSRPLPEPDFSAVAQRRTSSAPPRHHSDAVHVTC